MRKVLFKKWIPQQWKDIGRQKVEGTGIYTDFNDEGLFHQWANGYEEGENNFGNYTYAIVELNDGTIKEVLPTNLKFIEQ